MNTLITTITATGIIGFLAGILLVIASKLMYVKVDEKITAIREALPGANCGVCGYSGCDSYAAALAGAQPGEVSVSLCRPGGAELSGKLGGILGVEESGGTVVKIALVCCAGNSETKTDKMEYEGINTCFAAEQLFGGKNACTFGCLGYGDCASVCPQDAICITSGNAAQVDTRKCIGCEKCVAACPRGIIGMFDDPVYAVVFCKNTEKGAVVRKKCTVGCITCSKCVRECPEKAITIKNFLAEIDEHKCTGCGRCAEVCMTGCITIRSSAIEKM